MSETPTHFTSHPPPLTEVNLRARRSLTEAVLVIIGALIGLIAVSAGAIVAGVTNILMFTAIEVVFICLLVYLVDRSSVARLDRRVEYLVNAHAHFALALLLERAFAERSLLGPERRFALLTRVLATAGRIGNTIRNSPARYPKPIEPIAVPFEPHPLDHSDTPLGQQAQPLEDQPDADLLEPEALEQLRQQTSEGAHIERKTRKGLGWLWAALLVLPTTAGAMYAFARGEITWPAIFLSVVVLFALIGCGQATELLQRKQWFVVPGGLVLRKARLVRPTWDLHCFRQRDSVLIAHRVDRNWWKIFVADAEDAEQVTVTPKEAHFLLRAWLSPIPPPPVDQLTDLT